MAEEAKSTLYNAVGLPRIPLNLSDHKRPIGIHWGAVILTSGILPIVGYFALHYGVPSLKLNILLAPWLGLMGVVSVYSLGTRTYFLAKKNSTCRPLGVTSRWALDFFGWNFIFGFVVLTVLISVGISTESLEAASLPLSVLILYVCLELLIVEIMMSIENFRAPFRFSSVPRGAPLRPGSYVIAEDCVAVDGRQGQRFRQAWNDRYEASPVFRAHLRTVDTIWGVSGLCVVAAIWAVVMGVGNRQIGYAIGWGLPWIWAATMSFLTIHLSKRMLRREAATASRNGV